MADLTELVRYRTGSGSGLVTGVLSGDVGVGPTGSWGRGHRLCQRYDSIPSDGLSDLCHG